MSDHRLIDAHVHLNHYHEGDQHLHGDQVDPLFKAMAAHGVDHAVVITSYTENADRPGVQEVLVRLSGDARTTVVEGLRWRGEDRTDLFAMEQRIREGQVRGIKLYPGYEPYPINDPSLEAVFTMAAKYDVPVLIHTGDTYAKHAKVRHAHPLLVDDVAVDYRDSKFVMCHLGNPWFMDAAEVLYKNENVFGDISGLTLGNLSNRFERYMLDKLTDMITYMGDASSQIMYGSDWPLVEMGPYIDFLNELPMDEEHRESVAWRTAARLFDIPLP